MPIASRGLSWGLSWRMVVIGIVVGGGEVERGDGQSYPDQQRSAQSTKPDWNTNISMAI